MRCADGGGHHAGEQGGPLLVVDRVQVRRDERAAHREQQAEVGERVRRQRRVDLAAGLGDAHEIGEPVRPLADVVAHRPGDVLVATGRDQRLDDEVAAGVAAAGQPPADDEQQVGDRPAGIGGEHLGEHSPPVRPQRGDEQFRLRAEVRVQRAVADAGGRGDVGHPGAVVSALGEDVGGRPQQPLTGVGGGDACDAAHDQN